MAEVQRIKQFNSDYKMSALVAIIMCLAGCGMLTSSGWKEIFIGIFFVIGSIVLMCVAVSRKRTFEKLLNCYLSKKLKEYFKEKNVLLKFVLERRKKVAINYVIYVNGYVNKMDFEEFMNSFITETGVKMKYKLLRKPATSI